MEIKAITLPESRDKDACYDFFFRVYRWWYNHNNDEPCRKNYSGNVTADAWEATTTKNGNLMTGISGG